ncbi:MAG TPA: DNA polymerase/3'-5' exonuclease PolX [Syntrophorhabdus sp.]|jgi:DNA polymerase (family 10)|nr:DNA polymerase/3'-5' exonuclease PolX [Syntrophorhabdus sp.]HQG25625.1 DNA polymerase/3'-5' exonuclease PolX [Syntrophorhabdus sp.]HQH81729.1 DNA polymerase/3'-5' exonuclease PolX [Syntrophorhabdus sp.]HQI95941.1 DNA polymerase/3'-5' exonuclease PolX [Syntrophorhabdus sp.]HQM27508.1 DNA polymerase/3'-5' exonuclease PolX [Syntrophorhabdus sp.]
MQKKPVSDILENIAMLLEIKGENPFKSRAYYNAAKALSGITNLEELVKEKRLREIKGIGEALSQKIEEYSKTGTMAYYEELTQVVPESLLELMQIPNLGPKKIKVLYDELEITNIGELEYACKENRLIHLTGFGEKTQENVLKGIEFFKRHKGEFLFGDVYQEAERIRQRLSTIVDPIWAEVCGSIRRRKEVVRDMDILVAAENHEKITSFFVSMPEVDQVLVTGETKTSVRMKSGIEADLRVVTRQEFPYALVYFTGSKEHNVRLRGIAKKKGWKLNEYGIFDGDNLVTCKSEEEIYRALGLPYIPPELREDSGEIEAAEQDKLPSLIQHEDIRGIFHVHTDFSDGVDSLERMVEAAQKFGFSYLGVSDHSKTAYYAGGLKHDAILKQWEVIDTLNKKNSTFRIFKGIESDILSGGSLDYDDSILEGFDFVIASVHSGFTMKKDDMEERILKAMKNPYTTILGHPTGRLLLSRDGYQVDMMRIIDCAAQNHVILELNASPYRLDIDWRYLKYAKDKGVMISINPDAHAVAGLEEVFFGVNIARKGWQESKDILNTRDVNDIKEIFTKIRNAKRHQVNHS